MKYLHQSPEKLLSGWNASVLYSRLPHTSHVLPVIHYTLSDDRFYRWVCKINNNTLHLAATAAGGVWVSLVDIFWPCNFSHPTSSTIRVFFDSPLPQGHCSHPQLSMMAPIKVNRTDFKWSTNHFKAHECDNILRPAAFHRKFCPG